MSDAIDLPLAGQTLRLLPERAALWVEAATLLVADLHWGKSEALQKTGIPLPSAPLDADLARLAAAALRGATRIIALGDLVHARG